MIYKLWFPIINKINLVGYETIKKHIDIRAKSTTEKEISKSTACLMGTYYFINILFQSVLTHMYWVMIENSFHSPQQHSREKVFSHAVPWEQVSLFLFCFPISHRSPAATAGAPKALPLDPRVRRARGTGSAWLTAVSYFPCPSSASPTEGRPPPRIWLRARRSLGSLRPRARHDPRLRGRDSRRPPPRSLSGGGTSPARLEPLAPYAGTSASSPEMSSTISTLRWLYTYTLNSTKKNSFQ